MVNFETLHKRMCRCVGAMALMIAKDTYNEVTIEYIRKHLRAILKELDK
tara:strand:+ start:211 stop:357 length:147 start_codon:yes stop_codon:yes gene_type:complete